MHTKPLKPFSKMVHEIKQAWQQGRLTDEAASLRLNEVCRQKNNGELHWAEETLRPFDGGHNAY